MFKKSSLQSLEFYQRNHHPHAVKIMTLGKTWKIFVTNLKTTIFFLKTRPNSSKQVADKMIGKSYKCTTLRSQIRRYTFGRRLMYFLTLYSCFHSRFPTEFLGRLYGMTSLVNAAMTVIQFPLFVATENSDIGFDVSLILLYIIPYTLYPTSV